MNLKRILIFLKIYTVLNSYQLLKLLYESYYYKSFLGFNVYLNAVLIGVGCGLSCFSITIIFDWDLFEFLRPLFDILTPFFSFVMHPLDPLNTPFDFLVVIPSSNPLNPPIDVLISMPPLDLLRLPFNETPTLNQDDISIAENIIKNQEELKNAKSVRAWLIPAIAVACAFFVISANSLDFY